MTPRQLTFVLLIIDHKPCEFLMTERGKYHKQIRSESIDVYDVLVAFDVKCPAIQHAIKKLLMPGQRGEKTCFQDLGEAKASIDRAIELEAEQLLKTGTHD